MSMKLMVEAMGLKVGNSTRKLVLLKLADQANDKGECWPSYKTIAQAAECSRTTAISHIEWLENHGFLRVESRKIDGRTNMTNVYHLTIKNGYLGGSDSELGGGPDSELGGPDSELGGPDSELGGSDSELGGSDSELGGGSDSEPKPVNKNQSINQSINQIHNAPANADACVESVATAKPKKPTLAKQRKQDALQLLADHGVDGQLALDFLTVREDRKARTLTQTAIAGLEREAVRAGLTLAQAVTVCVERNWAGFNADWLHSSGQQGSRPQPERQSVKKIPQHTQGGVFLAKDIL